MVVKCAFFCAYIIDKNFMIDLNHDSEYKKENRKKML